MPGAFMMLLWISVFFGGQSLLTTTVEEKSSRVMEVLLSAVSPLQLMTGKILGQMFAALTIMVLYAGSGLGALFVFKQDHLLDPLALVYLVVFFVIAFFIIASIMAAVGSAVNDMREAQALMGPIMSVLVIPMILWMPISRNPNSTFAQVCSFVPPINPFIMVVRLAGSEKVPAWQVPVSILVGVLTMLFCAWAAAKVFRVGVLMYGKPPNLRTLIKWVRMA
jgi:ABC-2 type transport system permease protein